MNIAIVGARPRAIQLLLYVLRSQQFPACWVAKTGKDAMAQAQRDAPDVVLMDLALPDCISAIQGLRRAHTCDVLIVSESLARDAAQAYAAVAAGALDAVSLPRINAKGQPVNLEPLREQLTRLEKQGQQSRGRDGSALIAPSGTRSIAEAAAQPSAIQPSEIQPNATQPNAIQPVAVKPVAVKPIAVKPSNTVQPITASSATTDSLTPPPLIVVGASTGGPMAIATLLAALPADFPAAIVIAQHVNARFADRLTQWFQSYTALGVTAAGPGMAPASGQIFLAAEDRHLVMRPNGTLGYRDPSPELYYCPSVNLFFDSVANHWKYPGVAVLLTGMGRDGALGMKTLRDRGWLTVVQDEASASIHSMPKAAVELGAAMQELAPEQIAALLIRRYT